MLEAGMPQSEKDLNLAEADVNDASHRIIAESKAMKSQATNYEGIFEEMKKAIDDLKVHQLDQLKNKKAAKSAKSAHAKDIAQDSVDKSAIFVQLAKQAYETADKQLAAFQADETKNGLPDDPEVKDSVMETEAAMKKYVEELNGTMEDADDDVKEAKENADLDTCNSKKTGKDRIADDHACNLIQLQFTKLEVNLFTARRRLHEFEKASKCKVQGKKTVCQKQEAGESVSQAAEEITANNKKAAAEEAEVVAAVQQKEIKKAALFKIQKEEEQRDAEDAEKLKSQIKVKTAELDTLESKLKALKDANSKTEQKVKKASSKKEKKVDDTESDYAEDKDDKVAEVSGRSIKDSSASESVRSTATEHTRKVAKLGPLEHSAAGKKSKVFDEKKNTIDDNGAVKAEETADAKAREESEASAAKKRIAAIKKADEAANSASNDDNTAADAASD